MSTTPVSTRRSTASFLARRPVWQVSYLSGLAASVAVETWGLAARAAGVPMRAAGLGSHHVTPITVGMFAMGTMVVTFWFTFAVIIMARFAKNPKHLPPHGAATARSLPRRAAHDSRHSDLDQAHPRRRTPDRRCDHHPGSREATVASTVSSACSPSSDHVTHYSFDTGSASTSGRPQDHRRRPHAASMIVARAGRAPERSAPYPWPG